MGCTSSTALLQKTCNPLPEDLAQAGQIEFKPLEEGTSGEVVTLIQELAEANRNNYNKHKQVVKLYDSCINYLKAD